MMFRPQPSVARRRRRGSALLACTIAAVAISFVVLSLARTIQISHFGRKANLDAAVARATAEGLYHRAKVIHDLGGTGVVRDPDSMIRQASAVVVPNGITGLDDVQVILYNAAPAPMLVRPLD